MTDLRTTQAGAIIWVTDSTPPLAVTQIGGEVFVTGSNPPVNVTQAGAEIFVDAAGKTSRVLSPQRAGQVPTVYVSDTSQKTYPVADTGLLYEPAAGTIVYMHPTALTFARGIFFVTGTGVTPSRILSPQRAGQVPIVLRPNTAGTNVIADLGTVNDDPTVINLPNVIGVHGALTLTPQSYSPGTDLSTTALLTLTPQAFAFNSSHHVSLDQASLTLAPQPIVLIQPVGLDTATLALGGRSFTATLKVSISRAQLSLTPQTFSVPIAALDAASLALTPQAFRVVATIHIARQTLTLTPQAFNVGVQIAHASLTLTPRAFRIDFVWRIAQASLTLTPQVFTQTSFTSTIVAFDPASLTLRPVAFTFSFVLPFLHMTQTPAEVAGTQDSDLFLTQQGIEAAVGTGTSDLRETQQIAEAAVVSSTAYLHQTQQIIEAATSIVSVELRVSQFALEVMRGIPTIQAVNANGFIVTPIYPVLPGLAFNVKRSLTFATSIQPILSGKEVRVGEWAQNRYTYELSYDLLRDWPTHDEYRLLQEFWLQQVAQVGVFLFSDPDDNSVAGQVLGIGTGDETQFQLKRTFGAADTWTDDVFAPDVLSAVYVDNVLQDASTYDLTYWNSNVPGVLSLHTAVPAGAVLTADFSYYWPVRFTDDIVTFEQFLLHFWEVKSVPLASVKGNNILLLRP